MASHAWKVYIITGAASGMGLSAVQFLLSRGARLAICDINAFALYNLTSNLSPEQLSRVFSSALSVTDSNALAGFLDSAKSHFGRVDGVANFAGTGGHRLGSERIDEMEEREYDFIMDLNVRALFYLLRHVLREGYFETGKGASMVHVTSMYAERGFLNGAVFTASKHAANGMVKAAALEVAGKGVRVNTVMPGLIDTPMARAGGDKPPKSDVPMGRPGASEEIASMVAFLLSDESTYITGAHMLVDGGANAAGKHD